MRLILELNKTAIYLPLSFRECNYSSGSFCTYNEAGYLRNRIKNKQWYNKVRPINDFYCAPCSLCFWETEIEDGLYNTTFKCNSRRNRNFKKITPDLVPCPTNKIRRVMSEAETWSFAVDFQHRRCCAIGIELFITVSR